MGSPSRGMAGVRGGQGSGRSRKRVDSLKRAVIMGSVKPIFSISGVRGVFGQSLFPETVFRYARAFGRFLGRGVYALGRDARPSGRELFRAAQEGLRSAGCEVLDLGVCPTPTVVYFVRQNRARLRGGAVITASHNPGDWNGMKFVSPEARFLFPEELAEFKKVVEEEERSAAVMPAAGEPGARQDAVSGHIAGILESGWVSAAGRRLRIGVDAVNGAASSAGVRLVQALDCEVKEIFCSPDAGFFPRGPEPTAENLTELGALVRKEALDAGFAFDPDGDRFSCVDERGVPLGEEATLALAGLAVLARSPGPVVVNLSTSRMIEELARGFGVKVERTRVGEAWVVRRMVETGAVFGGEGNGGVILPAVNLTRDGLVAAALLVHLLRGSGARLSELRARLPDYFMLKGRVATGEFSPERVISGLSAEFGGFEIERTEGLRLVGADWWVHIRQSNTEPAVRFVVEARDRAQAERIFARVRRALAGE